MHRLLLTALLLAGNLLAVFDFGQAQILFIEDFEDTNFRQRGWYDNVTPKLSSEERVPGSTGSLEFRFRKGAIKPDSAAAIGGQGTMRKKFLATDSVYIRFYVKYSSNWLGSNVDYHPHEFYLLTDKDGDWAGPAFTRLTFYVEQNGGRAKFGIQDAANIDTANIGSDLTQATENRGVAGCNGDSDGYGKGDCYASGSNHRNGKLLKSSNVLFGDSPGPYYKNDWHLIEVYVKLNSIIDGKGTKDGVIQYWFDGQPVMDYRNIMLRTGRNADMKFNQFIIGPYIGVGSPVDQAFWVDNLILATGIIEDRQPRPSEDLIMVTDQ
jgi:hypothetical protein